MTMARKRVPAALRRDLLAAKERGTPVRIDRDDLDDESYSEGLVVDVSPRLVLLNRITDAAALDGFEVLRLEDVTKVTTEWQARRFVERALELKGQARKTPAGPIDLAGMREAVVSANATYPLVVIDREDDPLLGDTAVGRIREEVHGGFRLHWMTPAARWEWDGTPYRWAEVTRLQFGNEYEQTLAMVAEADGSRPAEHPRDGLDLGGE
jgi:hypothetical protein